MCGMHRDEEDGEEKSKLVEREAAAAGWMGVQEKGGVGIQLCAKRPPAARKDPHTSVQGPPRANRDELQHWVSSA